MTARKRGFNLSVFKSWKFELMRSTICHSKFLSLNGRSALF
ncbi:uncharacterized protein METZ01_LOCUS308376 [marine metagenome]|uniref:Uncharacterized protein n=1 Tax=marine metagenome TaxID=408172 RepID=A0A382N6W1_9ZZZZ